MTIKSYIGSYIREIQLHARMNVRNSGKKSLLIFTTFGANDASSNLRGYSIATRLRSRGWHVVVCPHQLRLPQRQRLVRFMQPDVILMQTARHSLNRPRLYPGVPTVFDLDDADYIADHSRPAVLECLHDSAAVIAGSRAVARYCRQYNPNVRIVWTGTPMSELTYRPQVERAAVVTWPAVSPQTRTREAEFILEVIRIMMDSNKDFIFRLYADVGTEAYKTLVNRFAETGVKVETRGYLDYSAYLETLEEVAVGLAPLVDVEGFSGGASFGKILAFLDRGVPVVAHPTADHPLLLRSGENGILADGAEEWAAQILQLLADPDRRERLARGGRDTLEKRLSTSVSGDLVGEVLDSVIGPER